jgi:hypothetical protein
LVVTAKDDPKRRGVVVWSNGRGIKGHYRMFADDSYVIQKGTGGAYVIGNDVDSWVPVSETEWSAVERVISSSARWEPVTWDDPAENDDHGFALMAALLPSSEQDRVFGDGDWPCDYLSLAKSVAEWLDESTVAANDSATNGVGMDPFTDAQAAHDAAGHVSDTWRTCGASECRAAQETLAKSVAEWLDPSTDAQADVVTLAPGMLAPCCDHCGCQPGDRTGHDDYCATDGCVGSCAPDAPEPDIRVVMPNAAMAEKMTLAIRCANAEAALAAQSTDLRAARARIEALEESLRVANAEVEAYHVLHERISSRVGFIRLGHGDPVRWGNEISDAFTELKNTLESTLTKGGE